MQLAGLRLSSASSQAIVQPKTRFHELTAWGFPHLLSLRLSDAVGGGLGAGSAPDVNPARQGIAVQHREAPAHQHRCAWDEAAAGPYS